LYYIVSYWNVVNHAFSVGSY